MLGVVGVNGAWQQTLPWQMLRQGVDANADSKLGFGLRKPVEWGRGAQKSAKIKRGGGPYTSMG